MEKLNLNLDGFATPDELLEVGNVLRTLSHYATVKYLAMNSRLAGRINDALKQEEVCESYYNVLPEWAKW